MGLLADVGIVRGTTSATPGALALGADVPTGAQLALVFLRWASYPSATSLTALSSSFGDATILATTNGVEHNCAVAYVVVSSTGADHTITPTFSGVRQSPLAIGVVFVDAVDTSAQANWLRDFDALRALSITLDSASDDVVVVALANWGSTPAEPSGCTTLIEPLTSGNNRHRVVSVNAPGSATTTVTGTTTGNATIAGFSVKLIPPGAGPLSAPMFGANI